MLSGKTVLLGVTGSIAAYKIASLASKLTQLHADVRVVMTENATQFITPVTFETLTGHKCLVDTFDRNFEFQVHHVSLAKQADVVLIAPATANIIGKLAAGIADDMLTTTVLACKAPILIAPAMNTNMYQNPIVQDNLKKLASYGMKIIPPANGHLACGDTGDGKMPEPETLLTWILREIAHEKDLVGKKILVTAGPTQEALDPVRYLTNHSTGKMGYALAEQAMYRGADVTLVTGPTALEPPLFVDVVHVTTAAEMFDAVTSRANAQDAIFKAAAVADYRPTEVATEKQKKSAETITVSLTRTQDILEYLGAHKKPGQFLCGFAMETEHMVDNAREKMISKNLDLICANNLKVEGAGFGTDTNVVTLLQPDREQSLPIQSKRDVANILLDIAAEALQ